MGSDARLGAQGQFCCLLLSGSDDALRQCNYSNMNMAASKTPVCVQYRLTFSDGVTRHYLKIQEAASESKPFSPVLRQLQVVGRWHSPRQSNDLMANGAVLLCTGDTLMHMTWLVSSKQLQNQVINNHAGVWFHHAAMSTTAQESWSCAS